MMRKVKVFLIVLALIPLLSLQSAFAEEIEFNNPVYNAVYQIDKWKRYVRDKNLSEQGNDNQGYFESIGAIMNMAIATFLSSIDSNYGTIGETNGQSSNDSLWLDVDRNTVFVETGSQIVKNTDLYCQSRIEYKLDYIRLETEVYRQNEEFVGVQRIECASKDDDLVLLMIDYDSDGDETTCFAIQIIGETINTISCDIEGKCLDVVLNIKEWFTENEKKEWNKELLLPISTLYE